MYSVQGTLRATQGTGRRNCAVAAGWSGFMYAVDVVTVSHTIDKAWLEGSKGRALGGRALQVCNGRKWIKGETWQRAQLTSMHKKGDKFPGKPAIC